MNNIYDKIYPVGSIYIGLQASCPIAKLIPNSTWNIISKDRVLQGAHSTSTAGELIEAGLPNITGSVILNVDHNSKVQIENGDFTGAFSATDYRTGNTVSSSSRSWDSNNKLTFNANLSNSIYGNSDTVQPPAYTVNIWQRIS